MATVGAKLTIPFTVGAAQIVGQGNQPELWVLYSTDDVSVSTPAWNDATAKVKAFAISRGRESELSQVDAGTATITLDNRTRSFDPISSTSIRPLNRWRIMVQFSGETQSLFVGYAESYDQVWPSSVGDAEAVVNLADEFKVLTLSGLPTTSPPRSSYAEVIQSQPPAGYWPMDDPPEILVQSPAAEVEQPAVQTEPPTGPVLHPGLVWGDDWGWG